MFDMLYNMFPEVENSVFSSTAVYNKKFDCFEEKKLICAEDGSAFCLSSMLRQAYRGRYCGENCTLIETTPPIFTEQPVICN